MFSREFVLQQTSATNKQGIITKPAYSCVVGSRWRLRLISLQDTSYVRSFRSNSQYNRYFSAINGSVDGQRERIRKYKVLEAKCAQFYYVFERLDWVKCELVRLCDSNDNTFT